MLYKDVLMRTHRHWTDKMNDHDDVINWEHFPHYLPLVLWIHWWPVNSPHKGQWHGALMFSLICAWINGWANNRVAGYLRRHRAHYDVIVMYSENVWRCCGIWQRITLSCCYSINSASRATEQHGWEWFIVKYYNTLMWHFDHFVTFWTCLCGILDHLEWLFGPVAVPCQWHTTPWDKNMQKYPENQMGQ